MYSFVTPSVDKGFICENSEQQKKKIDINCKTNTKNFVDDVVS